MVSFLLSMVVFVGALCCHVIVYRAVVRSPKTIAVFLVGFGVLASLWEALPLPLTTMSVYGALVAGYLLYFVSYLSDAESPSAKVLSVVRAHGPLGRRAILAHFTDEELIGKRIARLIRFGWVEKNGEKLVVTRHGALIAGMFAWYRRLLGWGEGG